MLTKIIDFLTANWIIITIFAVAIAALIAVVAIIALKKQRAKKDAEYAKMFEEVPIENDDSENVDFNEKRFPIYEKSEMDWLKGELGLNGVLRTEKPPLKKRENNETTNKNETAATATENASQKIKVQVLQLTIEDIENTNEQTEETLMTVKETAVQNKKVTGKWFIKEKGEGEFVAYLYANNKEVMLTSETYSTADGAKKGIETIRKNASDDNNFTYYKDKNNNYYFKLKTSKNRFLCAGATYPNKSACLKSIESVKKFIDSPVSDAVEKDVTIIKYIPQTEKAATKKYSGKWTIVETDDMFMAQLFASNGELMLSSEAYASYSSAKDAAKNIKDNGLKGNIIIDRDKKGRYFFKIRNSQKLTLCVGETYSQLSVCQNAIESVRAFLQTAKLPDAQ